MCYINWKPDDSGYSPRSPGPRPLPQLKWAMPLNPVKLGASLEAFVRQLPQFTALRLCHRFGTGPLPTLPQEILDHIISDAHQLEQTDVEQKWDRKFRCFQGRCTRVEHLEPPMSSIDKQWRELFTRCDCGCGCYGRDSDPLDPNDYTTEEKEEMILDHVYQSGMDPWDEEIQDDHYTKHSDWLELVCLCKKTVAVGSDVVPFQILKKTLNSYFGLDVAILHEALPKNLERFLPDALHPYECMYSTACFLTLNKTTRSARTAARDDGLFLKDDNHLAFYEVINPAQLSITEDERLRFARAMRVLNLKPHLHLSEIQSLIVLSNQDQALWAVCDMQISGCPAPTDAPQRTKKKRLQEYLQAKDEELAKRPWPQLMNIATSDVVVPSV